MKNIVSIEDIVGGSGDVIVIACGAFEDITVDRDAIPIENVVGVGVVDVVEWIRLVRDGLICAWGLGCLVFGYIRSKNVSSRIVATEDCVGVVVWPILVI